MIVRFLLLIAMLFNLHHGLGTLTLIIRASDGQPAAGIELALWEDRDIDGRTLVMTTRSDAQGQIVFKDLPWATYAIEFLGGWNNQPIQAVEQQNQAPLEDTGGIRGFGLRFSEEALTRLFVLQTQANGVVPYWDEAPSVDQPPSPQILAPMPPPVEAGSPVSAFATATPGDRPPLPHTPVPGPIPPTKNLWNWLLPVGCGVGGTSLLAAEWLARRRKRKGETGDDDA